MKFEIARVTRRSLSVYSLYIFEFTILQLMFQGHSTPLKVSTFRDIRSGDLGCRGTDLFHPCERQLRPFLASIPCASFLIF